MNTILQLDASDIARLWSYVIKKKCWLWTGDTVNGLGRIKIKHNHYMVRRLSYWLHFNVDPGDKFVLATCKNKLCCNPSHLYLCQHTGTPIDVNIEEVKAARAKGIPVRDIAEHFGCSQNYVYAVGGPPPVKHNGSKPTSSQYDIDGIIAMRKAGAKLREIAEKFSCSIPYVSAITRAKE